MTTRIDRYQLLRVLGRGGMGVVYLASDTLLDREVALKVVDHELIGDYGERLAGLFQQEARNLAGLNHPGIVQIFDYSGLYSSRLYLVMEYVPGRNLADVLSDAGPLSPMLVTHLGLAVAGVLAYAHAHGIIHQDLKPENILLAQDGRLKLTDFGISRRLAVAQQRSGDARIEVAGTPAYMAPEQAMGQHVDVRVDIFSLGATLYTLAAGGGLVEGLEPNETVATIARGDFAHLRTRRPEIPEALAQAIMRALAVDPAARYPDAMTFARTLAEIAGLQPPRPDDIARVPDGILPRLEPRPPVMPSPTPVATTMAAAPRAKSTVPASPRSVADTVDGLPVSGTTTMQETEAPSLPMLMDRFQLVRKLGSGALGELWLSYDRHARGERVAMKIFRPARGASIDEFKAEFRELSALQHPNLVGIRDFGIVDQPDSSPARGSLVRRGKRRETWGGAPVPEALAFYTMDFIEAPHLRGVAEGADLEQVYELLVQLARALVFLHTQTKRPHLSLKPENILVTTEEDGRPRVVLTDPGNPTEKLRSIHRGERTSLPYAAPETLSGLAAGLSADLYAFGVIAFELLAGRRPFEARTPETLKAAHLSQAPPDLRLLRPEVPAPIAEVVHRLLQKEPSHRPHSAAAWIAAVNHVVVPPYPLETQETRLGRFSSAPWMGRRTDLKALVGAFHSAMEPGSRAQRLLFLVGERGIGKGRLMDELKRTAQLEGAQVLEGRPAVSGGQPYGPLLPVLAARYPEPNDPRLSVEHRVALALLFGGETGRESDEGGPAPLDTGSIAELLVADIRLPTVMLFRHTERMGKATLDVLSQVSRMLAPMSDVDDDREAPPLFIALTVREGAIDDALRARLDGLPGSRWLRLGPLDSAAVSDMLHAVFGNQPLPRAEVETLRRVTGGNPGDIQDVLYTLIEAGDLVYGADGWQLRPGVAVPLPKSVEDALHRRLDALSRDERDVLETLCVFTQPVPTKIIDSLGPTAPAALQQLVDRVLLVRRMVDDEVCLAFSNDRLREALFRDLSTDVRETRHRQAALWLETHRPSDQVIEALAHHWSAGGRPERALSFLLEAADRTNTAGDLGRTMQWYGEALEMLPRAGMGVVRRLETEAKIRRKLGMAARSAGDLVQAEGHFKRLLEIGRDLESDDIVTTAVDRLAIVMIDALRFEDAISYAQRGHDMALNDGNRRGQAMALRLLGSIRRDMGDPKRGLANLHRALRVAGEDADLADVRARIAVTLSYSYTAFGDPAKGVEWAEWGLALARAGQLVEMEVSLLINLSMAGFLGGRPEQALRAAREALAVSRSRGLKHYYTLALGNMGDSLRVLGHYEEAEMLLRAALRDTYTVGANDRVVSRLIELSALTLDRGSTKATLPYLREAWRLVPALRSPSVAVGVALTELRLRLWGGVPEQRACATATSELLRQAATQARAQSDAVSQVRALALVATAAVARSPDAARATARDAMRLSAALPPPGILLHTDAAFALFEVLEQTGDADASRAMLADVVKAIERCAELIEAPAFRASFLAVPVHVKIMAARDRLLLANTPEIG